MDFIDLEYLVNLVDLLDFTQQALDRSLILFLIDNCRCVFSCYTVTAAGLLLPKQKFIHFWREEKKSTLVANVQMHKIR